MHDYTTMESGRKNAEDRAGRGTKVLVPNLVRTGPAAGLRAKTDGPVKMHGNTGFGKGGEQNQLNNP